MPEPTLRAKYLPGEIRFESRDGGATRLALDHPPYSLRREIDTVNLLMRLPEGTVVSGDAGTFILDEGLQSFVEEATLGDRDVRVTRGRRHSSPESIADLLPLTVKYLPEASGAADVPDSAEV